MDPLFLFLFALTGLGAVMIGPTAIIWTAAFQLRSGNVKRAIWLANQGIRFYMNPTSLLVFRAMLNIYYYSKHDEAIADTTQAIKLTPKSADAYSKRSYAYYRLGEIDRAMKDLDRAIELQQDSVEVYKRRAQILTEYYQDFDAATDEYEQALQHAPSDIELYYLMAQNYIYAKDYAVALNLCQHGEKNGIEPAHIHMLRATIIANQYGYEQARKDISQSLQLAPQDETILAKLAHIYHITYMHQDAAEVYTNQLEIRPKRFDLYTSRGEMYRCLNQLDQALHDHNYAMELLPHYVCFYNRAVTYINMNQLDDALRDLQHCLTLEPIFHMAHTARGTIYYLKGDFDAAEKGFEKAQELHQNDVWSRAGLAVVHYQLGHVDAAKAHWSQLIEIHSKFEEPEIFQKQFNLPEKFISTLREVASLS